MFEELRVYYLRLCVFVWRASNLRALALQIQPQSSDKVRFVPWQTWRPVMRNFASTISQRDVLSHVGKIMDRHASQHARKQQEALFSGSEDHAGGEVEERQPLLSETGGESPANAVPLEPK